MNKILLFKTAFIIFIICFAALAISCGNKKEVNINRDNYNNYITITVKLKSLQRADGTKINGSSKLYSDSCMPFIIEVKNKNGVDKKSVIEKVRLLFGEQFKDLFIKFESILGFTN